MTLKTKGVYVIGSHGGITIRDSSSQATTPGHCTDSKLKHTPSFSDKGPIWLSGSFGLRDRLLAEHAHRRLEVLREGGQWIHSFYFLSAFLLFTGIFQEEAYTLV